MAIELPRDADGKIVRLDHGITLANAPGIIDPGYRGERTCHPVIEDETEVCSECGEDIGGYGWTYCPNCGAAISL